MLFFAVKAQEPSVVVVHQDPTCFGSKNASYTITVYGGTATTLTINGVSTPIVNNTYSATGISNVINAVVVIPFEVTGITPVFDIHDTVFLTPKAPITTLFTVTPAACAASKTGSATVTVTGGTPPYSYTWTNGKRANSITNVAAGTYSVLIKDAYGCIAKADTTVVIGIDQPISPLVAITDPTCSGYSNGSIDLSVTGGSGDFLYEWLPGKRTTQKISGLTTGLDSLIIKDQKDSITCRDTLTAVLRAPAVLSVTIMQDSGANGTNTLTATVSGGTPPYNYNWSTGATTPTVTNMPVGTYTFSATDANSCFLPDVKVKVSNSIFPIYSTITPNGDGINDVWDIPKFADDSVDYKGCTVTVYNQWNAVVFQSNGYSKPWGGTDTNGKLLPVGTYFYVIYTGPADNKTHTGSLLIIY